MNDDFLKEPAFIHFLFDYNILQQKSPEAFTLFCNKMILSLRQTPNWFQRKLWISNSIFHSDITSCLWCGALSHFKPIKEEQFFEKICCNLHSEDAFHERFTDLVAGDMRIRDNTLIVVTNGLTDLTPILKKNAAINENRWKRKGKKRGGRSRTILLFYQTKESPTLDKLRKETKELNSVNIIVNTENLFEATKDLGYRSKFIHEIYPRSVYFEVDLPPEYRG